MKTKNATIGVALLMCICFFTASAQRNVTPQGGTTTKRTTTTQQYSPSPNQSGSQSMQQEPSYLPDNQNADSLAKAEKKAQKTAARAKVARYSFLLFAGGDIDPHRAQGSPFGGGQFQVNLGLVDVGCIIQGKNTIYRKISEDTTEINKFYSGGIALTILRVPETYNKNFSGTGVGAQLNIIWDNYRIDPAFPVMAGFYIKGQYNFGKKNKKGASFSAGIKGNLMIANYKTVIDDSKQVPSIFGTAYIAVNIHRLKK